MEKVFACLIILFVLSSCMNQKDNQPIPENGEKMANDKINKNVEQNIDASKIFEVKIQLVIEPARDKVLNLNAEMLSISDDDFEILQGDKLFDFYISDDQGRIVNTIHKDDLGRIKTFNGHTSVLETFSYSFKTSGKYQAWAVARFTIFNNSKGQEITLKTNVINLIIP